jgi:putative transposase
MTNYRRNFVPGGSYFFTVNLADRRLSLLTDHIDLLRVAFRDARARHPFTIDAAVILPDHLHAMWTLPEGDRDFATRWRLIKSAFSRALPKANMFLAADPPRGSAEFGSGATGSTPCAMRLTMPATPTTFISIR